MIWYAVLGFAALVLLFSAIEDWIDGFRERAVAEAEAATKLSGEPCASNPADMKEISRLRTEVKACRSRCAQILNNPGQPLLDELHALQVECKELKRELARNELKRCEPK